MLDRRTFLRAGTAVLGMSALPNISRAADEQPFRIGALNPVTGAGSQYGSGMQNTIRAAIDLANQSAGPGTRQLQFFAEDTQSRPEQAVLAAKKLVEVNKVDAIIGTWSSGEAMAVLTSVTNPNKIIHMTLAGAAEFSTERQNDMGWRFAVPASAYGAIYAKAAKELGFKRPAVMSFNNPSGNGQASGFTEAWKKGGGEIVATAVYEGNRPSYRSEVQSILAAKPDVIIVAGYIVDTTSIVREWYQMGIPAKFFMPYWAADQKLIDALGPEATEDINIIAPELPADSQSYKTFDEIYRKLTGNSGLSNSYAAMCFDMVNVLALAVSAAGPSAGREAVNAQIRAVSNPPGKQVYSVADGRTALKDGDIDYSGACSSLQFNAVGDEAAAMFRWQKIKGGKIETTRLIGLLDG